MPARVGALLRLRLHSVARRSLALRASGTLPARVVASIANTIDALSSSHPHIFEVAFGFCCSFASCPTRSESNTKR